MLPPFLPRDGADYLHRRCTKARYSRLHNAEVRFRSDAGKLAEIPYHDSDHGATDRRCPSPILVPIFLYVLTTTTGPRKVPIDKKVRPEQHP